jgi:hypothetical protein
MVVRTMSAPEGENPNPENDETPDWVRDLEITATDGPDTFVKPQPDIPEEPTPEKPQSTAERLKARFAGRAGAGRAAGEPSTSDAAPRVLKGKKPAPPKPREGTLVKPLTDMYTSVGLMLAPFDQACSFAFIENADSCARAMEKLARENESVRRVINAMLSTSAWGGVIAAHLPILLVIMMHHGPKEMQDRIAPMALMMNPGAMQKFAEAQQSAEENAA